MQTVLTVNEIIKRLPADIEEKYLKLRAMDIEHDMAVEMLEQSVRGSIAHSIHELATVVSTRKAIDHLVYDWADVPADEIRACI